jgi:hypothetical protein
MRNRALQWLFILLLGGFMHSHLEMHATAHLDSETIGTHEHDGDHDHPTTLKSRVSPHPQVGDSATVATTQLHCGDSIPRNHPFRADQDVGLFTLFSSFLI